MSFYGHLFLFWTVVILINTFCSHINTFYCSIVIIEQTIYADRPAETTSLCINAAIVINKIPVVLKLYD